MSRTQDQLVNRVLLDMTVIGLGQTASDEVYEDVSGRCETIVAELNSRDVVNIDLEQIDDGLFEPLIEYIIAKAGPGYGRGELDPVHLAMIEDRIKEVVRPVAARKTLSTDPILRQGIPRIFRGTNFTNGS